MIAEDVRDIQGRTPLHAAVINGCDLQVVLRLMNGGSYLSSPVMRVDNYGRTPLHWACCRLEAESFKRKPLHRYFLQCHGLCASSKGAKNRSEVIQSLVVANPEAVSVKDINGKRPIDLAHEHGSEAGILKILLDAETTANRSGLPLSIRSDHHGMQSPRDHMLRSMSCPTMDKNSMTDDSPIVECCRNMHYSSRNKDPSMPLELVIECHGEDEGVDGEQDVSIAQESLLIECHGEDEGVDGEQDVSIAEESL